MGFPARVELYMDSGDSGTDFPAYRKGSGEFHTLNMGPAPAGFDPDLDSRTCFSAFLHKHSVLFVIFYHRMQMSAGMTASILA